MQAVSVGSLVIMLLLLSTPPIISLSGAIGSTLDFDLEQCEFAAKVVSEKNDCSNLG